MNKLLQHDEEIIERGVNLLNIVSNYIPYISQSAYFQLFTSNTPNNKLKNDCLRIAQERKESYSLNLDKLLSAILHDRVHDVFLKPSKIPDDSPKSVMELINLVNRDGFYLLFCRSALVIFLRGQHESVDNERNGALALEKLCAQLYPIVSATSQDMKNISYFVSDVEKFSFQRLIGAPTFVNFFPITENIISNNMIVLLNNLDRLSGNTEHSNSVNLLSFKNLFLLQLLKILRYGNVTKGTFHPQILESVFYLESSDLKREEEVKRSIKKVIIELTNLDPDRSSNFAEIINHPDAGTLIRALGFNINLYCSQIEDKCNNIIDISRHRVHNNPTRGSYKNYDAYNEFHFIRVDNPSEKDLDMNWFLNEICLSMFNSCFHGSCLILTDDYHHHQTVIDFQQIRNYQLSLDKHCSIQTVCSLLPANNFLELLSELSPPEDVELFLRIGSVEWSKLQQLFIKVASREDFQFARIIVCQSGLERNDADGVKRINLHFNAKIEMFPHGILRSGTYSSADTILISIRNGIMRRVLFDEFIVRDTSSTTDILGKFVVH